MDETAEIERRLKQREHDMQGNGRAGLLERQTIVETQFETIEVLIHFARLPEYLEELQT